MQLLVTLQNNTICNDIHVPSQNHSIYLMPCHPYMCVVNCLAKLVHHKLNLEKADYGKLAQLGIVCGGSGPSTSSSES